MGKISNLTSIFFRWVGSTTNQLRTGLCFDWDHASFGPVQCLGGTQLEVREIDSKRLEKIQGGVKPGSRRIGGIRSIITQLATFIYIYIQVVYKWYVSCQLGDYISPIPPMKGTRNNHRKIVPMPFNLGKMPSLPTSSKYLVRRCLEPLKAFSQTPTHKVFGRPGNFGKKSSLRFYSELLFVFQVIFLRILPWDSSP